MEDLSGSATVHVNGRAVSALPGERLADLLDRLGERVPHTCYMAPRGTVQQLDPAQTCDTCLVRADGDLRRACATAVTDGLVVDTFDPEAADAREEAK